MCVCARDTRQNISCATHPQVHLKERKGEKEKEHILRCFVDIAHKWKTKNSLYNTIQSHSSNRLCRLAFCIKLHGNKIHFRDREKKNSPSLL